MQKLLPIPSYSQGGKQKPTTTTTTTTRAYLTKHNIPIFCLWVLHHPKFFFNLQKGGKKKRELHNTKYIHIGLHIYHGFAWKKNTNNINNNQKKFVIMDMATTKGLKPILKFKIPPLTPPPTFPPT